MCFGWAKKNFYFFFLYIQTGILLSYLNWTEQALNSTAHSEERKTSRVHVINDTGQTIVPCKFVDHFQFCVCVCVSSVVHLFGSLPHRKKKTMNREILVSNDIFNVVKIFQWNAIERDLSNFQEVIKLISSKMGFK